MSGWFSGKEAGSVEGELRIAVKPVGIDLAAFFPVLEWMSAGLAKSESSDGASETE